MYMQTEKPSIDQDLDGAQRQAQDLDDFRDRLSSVSEQARKLLVHIAQLAYHGRGADRKAETAYLPELHESCGLDVGAMYTLLEELGQARFIEIKEQYPFESVAILPARSGWNALGALSRRAESQGIALREVLVDFRLLR